MAPSRFIILLWLVESIVSDSNCLLNGSRLFGWLKARRFEIQKKLADFQPS